MDSMSTVSAASSEIEVMVSSTTDAVADDAAASELSPSVTAMDLSSIRVIREDGTGLDASVLLKAKCEEKLKKKAAAAAAKAGGQAET